MAFLVFEFFFVLVTTAIADFFRAVSPGLIIGYSPNCPAVFSLFSLLSKAFFASSFSAN